MDGLDPCISGSRILIVDDDLQNVKTLQTILGASGFQTRTAGSGKEALDECETDPPDLMLLDIDLPGMSGYEVCTRVRSREEFKDLPVIFISGLSSPDEKIEAFQRGGVDYLTKPFHLEELRSRVRIHLEIRHGRMQLARYAEQLQNTINEMSALFETGSLVAGVVHDVKKFTSAMIMMLESMIIPTLKERLDPSEEWVREVLSDISEVQANSVQCTEFLETLLSINRRQEAPAPVDIVRIVRRTFYLVSYNLIQNGIQWEIFGEPPTPLPVMGNNQLIRVFMNLVVNAVEALKKHETPAPRITVRITPMDRVVQVAVIDNGPGIPEDVLKGIRKGMVLTTKGDSGNGFGVSGLTRILRTLDGAIDIESEIGKGASFVVTLKRPDREAP